MKSVDERRNRECANVVPCRDSVPWREAKARAQTGRQVWNGVPKHSELEPDRGIPRIHAAAEGLFWLRGMIAEMFSANPAASPIPSPIGTFEF